MTRGVIRRRMPIATALSVVAFAVLGCASAVSGNGTVAGGGASGPSGPPSGSAPASVPASTGGSAPGTDFPSSSGTSPTAPASPTGSASIGNTNCPRPTDATARLSWDCLGSSMKPTSSPIWQLEKFTITEPASQFGFDEGSTLSNIPASSTAMASAIAAVVERSIAGGVYLPGAKAKVLASTRTTISARPAIVGQIQITLNPQQAAKARTKEKVEHLWVVAIQRTDGRIALWHISIPDLVSKLWARVPALIKGIQAY